MGNIPVTGRNKKNWKTRWNAKEPLRNGQKKKFYLEKGNTNRLLWRASLKIISELYLDFFFLAECLCRIDTSISGPFPPVGFFSNIRVAKWGANKFTWVQSRTPRIKSRLVWRILTIVDKMKLSGNLLVNLLKHPQFRYAKPLMIASNLLLITRKIIKWVAIAHPDK